MQTPGRKYPLFLIALGILAAATAPLAAGFLWLSTVASADSTDLLDRLVTKAGFEQSRRRDIEFIGMDGNLPEISRQIITMVENAAEPMPALKRACAEIGLDRPHAEQRAIEPDTVCNGVWNGKHVKVNAALQCKAGPCQLAIETRAFGF